MTKMWIALIVTTLTSAAWAMDQAPGGPPPGFFPANMPNVGDLWIEICGPGGLWCYDTEAKVWGQVCDSSTADIVVNGPGNNASHISVPPLMHYAGWRCGKDGDLISTNRQGFYNNGKFEEYDK